MSKQPLDLTTQPHSQQNKIKWLIGLILLMFLILWGWNFWKKSQAEKQDSFSQWSKPVPVRVVGVQRGDLQLEIKAIGTVVPASTVNVQSQVSGVLQKIYFQEGQYIQKGQLLAQIDPTPFQVALAQAQGTQQQNLAQLHNAQSELARYQLLYKQDSIARQQVDQQQALVNQLKGQIQANQAQVDAAKLQLSYTKIYAPIDGRVGFRLKDAGNLIQANEATGLLSITQVHPIYVQFAVAENYLDIVREASKNKQSIRVSAWDRAEQKQLATGSVQALDNQIDLNTGTLKVKAVFANTDDALFPNQFVNVRLNAKTLHNVVHLPSDAIQHGAKGTYVYIINKENKAEVRMLKLGMVSQGQTEIVEGLQGNERVVLEGIDRLSEGQDVQVVQDDHAHPAQAKTVAG
ncbi:efflux RND transporter periplasmic adaptor subunit [Acinetobacter corruptisaponis]|uniref:Efflux RND transporter periplasmic adaptor subunit n=1 Tax=Acinetobacter corruptisaponis TaxID=3045147 RepID=A0ABY8S550_9GAMM|nr:efflux RND transporter periplasmic adaptor subunit [Acinetobacter sp. KCTC 92772]WHP05982.1 efflux RND transporter periplasmic adaptor subunit [Acinetobacter sp. KCTC 92772]